MAWKVLSHSAFHSPDEAPFKSLKKGLRQFEFLEMNLFNATSFFVKACICFLVLGGFVCKTAWACLGAILIQRLLTRKPSSWTRPRKRICLDSILDDAASLTEKLPVGGLDGHRRIPTLQAYHLYTLPLFFLTKV